MSLFRGLARSERRVFSGPWGEYDGRIPPPSMADGGNAGPPINARTALRIIDVFACVSLRSDAVGMLPFRAYRKVGDTRIELPTQPPLLVQPDPELSAFDFWAGAETSIALRGNMYSAVVDVDNAGYATSVSLLCPDDVRPPTRGADGRWRYPLSNGQVLDSSQIVHVRGFTPPGERLGLSTIECARRGLSLSVAAESYGATWFRDGASPSSVLETDQPLTTSQAKTEVARWVASHGGRRRPAVLSGGLKWRPITISPNESQFLETRQFQTAEIRKLFRVPAHMIGDITDHASQGGGKGLEEMGIGFSVYTIGPDLARLEAAFSQLLPRGQYVKANPAALLRGNTRDRFTAYAIGRQWGWLSVNDIRALEDLPPVDGGETYLQPLNMIDAQEALKVLLQPGPGGTP